MAQIAAWTSPPERAGSYNGVALRLYFPLLTSLLLAPAMACNVGDSNFDFDGDGTADEVNCAPSDPASV